MIEKITNQNQIARHKLAEKINELVDAVNELGSYVGPLGVEFIGPKAPAENMQKVDISELAFLSKEYSKLKDELDRTRKALDVAVDALKSAHEYYQKCVIRETRPQEINWYCTAMNMDNDIFKALEQITALEQKDK